MSMHWAPDLEDAARLALPERDDDLRLSPRRFQTRTPRERRIALAGTALVHVAVALALAFNLARPPVAKKSVPTSITFITLSNEPPAGDPNGDDAPAKPTEQPPEDKVTPPKDKPAEQDKPDEPKIELPSELTEADDPSEAAQALSGEFAELQGSGTIAFGAKTHGLGAGMDGDLAAAIGHSVATQISACWNAPRTNLPDDLAIIMTVSFAQDGSLFGEPAISRLQDENAEQVWIPNAYETAALEAVKRCSPIKLPASLYAYWQTVDVQIFSSVRPDQVEPNTATQMAAAQSAP